MRRTMSLSKRSAWTGRLFALPFYLGFTMFFLTPLVQTLIFAFSKVELNVGNYTTEFVKGENFYYIFRVDQYYLKNLLHLPHEALLPHFQE